MELMKIVPLMVNWKSVNRKKSAKAAIASPHYKQAQQRVMREDEKEYEERGEQQAAMTEHKQQHSITSGVARRPSKPNPYNYYQKLVQDFQSLDKELQAAASIQNDLHSKVDALQAQQQTVGQEHQQVQYTQWEREREIQIETIVIKNVEMEALRTKVDELDAQEIRLLAEIQVLQEKQQEEIRTEVFRINELVHTKTHLLEAELAKGKMDLEFIAQLVKKTHYSQSSLNEQDQRESAREKESIHVIAEEIQTRRRREFDLAAETLNARLLSFEHEKEALSKKANDIRARKQRALQILSTNQQEAIKTFFASAPASDSHAKKKKKAFGLTEEPAVAPPQLDFGSILASLNQSGAQVEQIQSARNEKMSTRKTMGEALLKAQTTLAVGERRIEALQKTILDRKRDAEAFNILSKDSAIVYDGKLGIESYTPATYELVYFIRGLLFSWLDRAVAEAESEPNMELLESEVQRWEFTHTVVEQEKNAHLRYQLASSQVSSIVDEVVREIAADIYNEFRADCSRVRETIGSTFNDVFFAKITSGSSSTSTRTSGSPTKCSASPSHPVLAADMFRFAFEQLQSTRKRRVAISQEQTHESVQFLHLMAQPKKIAVARLAVDDKALLAPSESPKKKRFGFFSSGKASEAVTSEPHVSSAKANTSALSSDQQLSAMNKKTVEMIHPRPAPAGFPDPSAKIAADKQFWQQMLVEVGKIVVPSSFSHSSCVETSSDASICAVGTTNGELLVWDLLHTPPLLLRSHVPPPKATKSSISGIAFSTNKTRILALDQQLKVIHVWNINKALKTGSSTQTQQQHSSDCFANEDSQKWKPQSLELLMELNSDSLLRPGLTEETRQLIPIEKSSTPILLPQFFCANWFSTTSPLGEQPSVICGISSGDILKSTFGATGRWFDTEVAAKFDAPTPSDLTSGLRFKNVKREFFCGHKHPVLFVKCLQSSKGSVKLLSIDSDGTVLEWEYDSKQFSGFGWFTPVRRNRLDLQPPTSSNTSSTANQKDTSTSSTEKKHGEILQIAATVDEKRIVVMVFSESPVAKKPSNSGRLVFYQLLLTPANEPIQLSPVQIQLEFVGNSPPPRFALSTVLSSGKRGHGGSGHFLFVLMNNSVQIMSLDTGANCCALIALQQKSEPSLVFTSFAVSARCTKKEKLHCCMAVAGHRHNRILLYRFKQQHQR